jgi:selenocysteine-specific elongation factor
MSVVIGTAGHIDHGKTTLLRALTGIDADRLPEERRRGMTIDVGYAHLALEDGTVIDFVDVPGHDRLVGNMLVGAGEIDASLLVVAADDGPRAQTHEHLALLDALDRRPRLVVITKTDLVDDARVDAVTAAIRRLVGGAVPIVPVAAPLGTGLAAAREAIFEVAAQVDPTTDRPPTLAIDRAFSVKGRGVIVTGSLLGGPLARGDHLRLVPGDRDVRVRGIQVRGAPVERVATGGRTALNLAGVGLGDVHRGQVLTADALVVATDRVLAAFRSDVPADRSRWRWHAGTAAVGAAVGRSGRDQLPDAGIVRLSAPVAVRVGDRFVLRRDGARPVGGRVLDAQPPRGISRRRQTPERVARLATGDPAARLDLHGALRSDSRVDLASDVATAAGEAAVLVVEAAGTEGLGLGPTRAEVGRGLRRTVSLSREDAMVAAAAVVETLVGEGRLVRDGDRLRSPGATIAAPDPAVVDAMDRLEAALAVPAPPPLAEAMRVTGCPPAGVRELERVARIVVLEPDLAYAMSTYRDLTTTALRLAAEEPLTPAALRDATGTSRKYVMAILEDLDRRAVLRRTPAGHVPGPRASSAVGS